MDTRQLYELANSSLNEVMFSGRYEGRPVYLSLDSYAKKALAEKFKKTEEQVEYFVAQIVGWQLIKTGDPYYRFSNLAKNWERLGRPGPPPFTAVVFALSFAASLMASSENYSSGNYYERLSQILHFPRERLSLHGRSTRALWVGLNKWLTENDYEFGRPTAQQINSNKYISYAQSQAVVRDGDRHLFHHLFKKYGFSGNEKLSNEEIEIYLSTWIHSSASNARLKSAWSKTELRQIFCGVVLAELESWSEVTGKNSVTSGAKDVSQSLSLALSVTPNFPKPSLTLLLGRQSIIDEPLIDLSLGTSETPLALSNDTFGGFASFSPNVTRRSNDVLLNEIKILDQQNSVQFSWRPRLIIPFKRSLEGSFSVEVNRVSVATDHDVLVRDRASFREKVDKYLVAYSNQQARVATESEISKIPTGWVLYRKVFIMPHDDEVTGDLEVLKPLKSNTGLIFKDGMNLGNGIWHSRKPPTLQVMSKSDELTLEVYKFDEASTTPLLSKTGERYCQIEGQDLEDLGMGEYRIRSQIGKKPAAEIAVNFRSADKPRPLSRKKLTFPYWDITGVDNPSAGPDTPSVEGISVLQLQAALSQGNDVGSTDNIIAYSAEEEWTPDFKSELVGISGPRSCVGRGHHFWKCETLEPGLKSSTPLNMECKDCREVVLTRNRGRKTSAKTLQITSPTKTWINGADAGSKIDFDVFFDGLCYLGMGNRARFERLLSSFVEDPKFISNLAQNLSALGHLDLRVRKGSGRFLHWSVPPAAIHFTDSQTAILSGFRSSGLITEISERIFQRGGKLICEQREHQPAILSIKGLNVSEVKDALNEVTDPLSRPVKIVGDPVSKLGQALVSLPGLEASFQTFSLGTHDDLSRFDSSSGKWRQVDCSVAAGAYRFTHAGPTYVLKRNDGTCASGPYQWIKTLAAKSAGHRLHSYNGDTKEFRAALGVEPVGLMTRALLLSTGELPHIIDKQTIFKNVDAGIASAVLYNLYHREII